MSKKNGVCHICGKKGKLTFEHIPPKSSGNSYPMNNYSAIDLMDKHNNNNLTVRYRRQCQQGAGGNWLCSSCNNYTGANYVNSFTEMMNCVQSVLSKIPQSDYSKNIVISTDKVNALAFFKECISIFCCINKPGIMSDCKEFLIDRDSRSFNKQKYKLCLVAIPEEKPVIRYAGFQQYFTNIFDEDPQLGMMAEFLGYPLGLIFYRIDLPARKPVGFDITNFSEIPFDAKDRINLSLPCMKLTSAMPGHHEFYQ